MAVISLARTMLATSIQTTLRDHEYTREKERTYVKPAFELAITAQLDEHDLVEGEFNEVKRLGRAACAFVNVGHRSCKKRKGEKRVRRARARVLFLRTEWVECRFCAWEGESCFAGSSRAFEWVSALSARNACCGWLGVPQNTFPPRPSAVNWTLQAIFVQRQGSNGRSY